MNTNFAESSSEQTASGADIARNTPSLGGTLGINTNNTNVNSASLIPRAPARARARGLETSLSEWCFSAKETSFIRRDTRDQGTRIVSTNRAFAFQTFETSATIKDRIKQKGKQSSATVTSRCDIFLSPIQLIVTCRARETVQRFRRGVDVAPSA